jgi:cell division septation protein DedD
MDQGAVRNLEQIQEHDDQPRVPRSVSVALVVLGGACIAFAALAISGRKTAPPEKRVDPLGDLVAQHGRAPAQVAAAGTALTTHEVTFPGILSDDGKPTTALAAVRALPTAAASAGAPSSPTSPAGPPPPTDRLSVVTFPGGTPQVPALPAQNVLEATPIVTRPRDALTKAATDSAQLAAASSPVAAAGHDGGYQLQVSSFRDQTEAASFADQLRARGHKAYVLEARVSGRGTWYRVRVGPFPTQQAAAAYRSTFEAKEHVVPFIVQPPSKSAGAAQAQ